MPPIGDLTLKEGLPLTEAIEQAQEAERRVKEAGYDQAALERAAQRGFDNALFEPNEEEVAEIMDEFYPSPDRTITGRDFETLSPEDSLMKVREIKSLLAAKATCADAKAAK